MYETLYNLEKTGIDIRYWTNKGQYTPPHWHTAIELIYVLNGTGSVIFDGKEYLTKAGDLLVIDSNKIHEMKCAEVSMMIIIQFSRKRMKNYVRDIDRIRITCSRKETDTEKKEQYQTVCGLLRQLLPLYVRQPLAYELKSQAIAMEILYELLNHFGEEDSGRTAEKEGTLKRLGEITDYIEEHYRETIPLEDIASHFYLNREYFSRFFKKNMGVSFSRYVNQVRLLHIYYDICNTEEGIMDLIEKHGFKNYKLFIKMFREIYGSTPREVRSERKGQT
ncbi:AraC family transcriptional regulator [Anaerostipes sp.]|uniref:AraC family transcriptional regulator n=1 Tax=Anaerostipes sp. TaxID=1872530 RepID=UPI0025BB3436|nr:AraC family transcriptional regulator [Anaerostipes sp.]MBS7009717.1 helix-turn-helix transcriptional regulator [Anaerostipes sp.]